MNPLVYNELVLAKHELCQWRALAIGSLAAAFLFAGLAAGSIIQRDVAEARAVRQKTAAGDVAEVAAAPQSAFDFGAK